MLLTRLFRKIFCIASGLTVVSCVAKKTVHAMTTGSLLHVAKVSKNTENKTNLSTTQIAFTYYCHLTISLPLTTKTNFASIDTGNPEIWCLRSLRYKKFRVFPSSGFFAGCGQALWALMTITGYLNPL